jgi:hypothetical protein
MRLVVWGTALTRRRRTARPDGRAIHDYDQAIKASIAEEYAGRRSVTGFDGIKAGNALAAREEELTAALTP